MERININETGNKAPEGMYITKKEAETIKFLSSLFVILTALLSLCNFKFKKLHK